VKIAFVIKAWAAFAPGLTSQEHWHAWAAAPTLPAGSDVPGLAEMPAMARRRLDPMGRMAVQVAWWCQGDDLGMPVVFASRYGDAARSLDMLGGLVRGEPVSPTAFGLSVHNAIGAQYSIARGDRANQLSVAAGSASAAAALVEAAALLNDGAPEVMVVCYDAPLPGAYAGFHDEPAATYAWAWRVARPAANEPHLELSAGDDAPVPPTPPALPFGLDVLRFALSRDTALQRTADHTCWTLRRHG
jgi:hypothetical protein